MTLTDFKVLTFDCYGTLIDWESGIHAALQPLLSRAAPPPPRNEILALFAQHESAQEAETPAMRYPEILAHVHRRLGAALGLPATDADHARFGASVPDWPAFPDSAPALQYLKQHYQLVILSNVHRAGFAASNERLGVTFDAIYTAEDIGSYKPSEANFDYLLNHVKTLGFEPPDILHTAQSLFHDHVPAKRKHLATAWIDRRHQEDGWGATMPAEAGTYDFRFTSMAEMADAHRNAVNR